MVRGLARLGRAAAAAAAMVLLLAACSTVGQVDPNAKPDSGVPVASYGTGPTKVALITAEASDELAGGAPESAFLAAELAGDIVAKAPITLLVWRYDGKPDTLKKIEDAVLKSGATLVIGPDDDRTAQSLAGTVGSKGVTVVSLGGTSAANVNLFAFGFSGSVEASLTADEMRRRGYHSIALVSDPKSTAGAFVSLLATAAVGAGIKVTPIDGSDPAGAAAQIGTMPSVGQQPSAIMFVTSPATATTILKKLRPQGLFSITPAVGISVWGFNTAALKGLGPGWYLAPDTSTIPGYTDRFSKAFGQASTPDGALVYDLLVLAAALPQLVPSGNAYGPEVLTNSQGFVGVTGKFWFTPDGQVHRNLLPVDLSAH